MKTTDNILYLPFVKLSGAGNDFVLIDQTRLHSAIERYDTLAKAICDRHRGVGADGLLVYKSHDSLDFEMDYYNADGSSGAMCGNGGRCIAAYHFDVHGKDKRSVKFMAFDTIYTARTNGDTISVHMKDPSHILTDITINVDGTEIVCHYIDTGTPHVVVFTDELYKFYPDASFDDFDIQYLGGRIRRHEAFRPLGTNVNFVEPLQDNQIAIRTYERGVENETLACGTGSVASAVITVLQLQQKPPVQVITRSDDIMSVHFSADVQNKKITDVILAGTWMYHFTGTVIIDKNLNYAGIRHLPDSIIQQPDSSIV